MAIRILLADAHTVMRSGLRLLLERQPDLQVVGEAADGREAVDLADSQKPDVVVMDIAMPRLNGLEATRRIRRQPWGRGMHVVALTGWGQDVDRRRSREAGFDMHLVKPVDPATICDMLVN